MKWIPAAVTGIEEKIPVVETGERIPAAAAETEEKIPAAAIEIKERILSGNQEIISGKSVPAGNPAMKAAAKEILPPLFHPVPAAVKSKTISDKEELKAKRRFASGRTPLNLDESGCQC